MHKHFKHPNKKFVRRSMFLLITAAAFLFLLVSDAHAVIFLKVYDKPESFGRRAYGIAVESSTARYVYIAGTAGAGAGEYKIVKYNSSGAFVARTDIFSGSMPMAAALDPTGQFLYVAGGFLGPQQPGVVSRYDSYLNLIASVSTNTFINLCDFQDRLNGVAVDSSGVYVVGSYEYRADIPPASCDESINRQFRFIKYDLSLTQPIIRQELYGSPTVDDYAYGVAVDRDGNAYVAGSGASGWAVVRFNSGGGTSLVETFPSGEATDSTIDPVSGNVYVAGTLRGGLGVIKTRLAKYSSTTLSLLWATTSRPYAQSYARGLAVDKFGNSYISGSGDIDSGSSYPSWIEKFDALGSLLWHYEPTGTNSFQTEGAAVDNKNNFYMTGWTGSQNAPSSDRFYTVATSQLCNGTSSLMDYTIPWTDDPIIPNETKIRATHITELRDWIDNRWNDATPTAKPYSWGNFPPLGSSDANIIPGQTKIRIGHINELRDMLSRSFGACNVTAPGLAGAMATTTIRASHIRELRDFTKSLPGLPY